MGGVSSEKDDDVSSGSSYLAPTETFDQLLLRAPHGSAPRIMVV